MFAECKTGEEVKALYKKLALKWHPDRGGDNESMKALNLAFEQVFNRLKDIHVNHNTGETYTKATYETPKEFIDLINNLFKLSGIVIEICGSFVWVSGNTKEHKDALKALGLKYSANKTAWYKAPVGYRKASNKKFSMDEIRDFYGSQIITKRDEEESGQVRLALN